MNKDCKVSIERDANGSLSVLLTGSCAVRGLFRRWPGY